MAQMKAFSLSNRRKKTGRVKSDANVTGKRALARKLLAARLKAKSAGEAITSDLVIALTDPGGVGEGKLRFGRVFVTNVAPDAETVWTNVDAGRKALKRATEVLVKPGVDLKLAADVPKFRVDAAQPGVLVREWNGVVQRGHLVGGHFIPAD